MAGYRYVKCSADTSGEGDICCFGVDYDSVENVASFPYTRASGYAHIQDLFLPDGTAFQTARSKGTLPKSTCPAIVRLVVDAETVHPVGTEPLRLVSSRSGDAPARIAFIYDDKCARTLPYAAANLFDAKKPEPGYYVKCRIRPVSNHDPSGLYRLIVIKPEHCANRSGITLSVPIAQAIFLDERTGRPIANDCSWEVDGLVRPKTIVSVSGDEWNVTIPTVGGTYTASLNDKAITQIVGVKPLDPPNDQKADPKDIYNRDLKELNKQLNADYARVRSENDDLKRVNETLRSHNLAQQKRIIELDKDLKDEKHATACADESRRHWEKIANGGSGLDRVAVALTCLANKDAIDDTQYKFLVGLARLAAGNQLAASNPELVEREFIRAAWTVFRPIHETEQRAIAYFSYGVASASLLSALYSGLAGNWFGVAASGAATIASVLLSGYKSRKLREAGAKFHSSYSKNDA